MNKSTIFEINAHFMIGFINLLTKIFIWIIRICEVWYRRLHWFHKELAINSVHIFTIRHSRKMHRHQRILIVSQWTDVEIRWKLTKKRKYCYFTKRSKIHFTLTWYDWMFFTKIDRYIMVPLKPVSIRSIRVTRVLNITWPVSFILSTRSKEYSHA